jgi:hypothetical protein
VTHMWSVLIYDNSTINNGNGVYNYLFILHKNDKIQRTCIGRTYETKEWYYDLSVGCVENNFHRVIIINKILCDGVCIECTVKWILIDTKKIKLEEKKNGFPMKSRNIIRVYEKKKNIMYRPTGKKCRHFISSPCTIKTSTRYTVYYCY